MAREPRPVTSAYMAEWGSAHLTDTYLSPLHYSGWTTAYSYERSQDMRFDPGRWAMQLDVRADLSRTLNPARSALMWQLGIEPRWAMLRKFALPASLSVAVGPSAAATAGVRYLPRNGNNPAQAQGAVTVGAMAQLGWTSNVARHPLRLRYQADMTLAGLFFAPDYDELYYEIWLGNHSGLCHAAWPGNYFRMGNLVTADLTLGRTTLRLGYRCNLGTGSCSGIVTRTASHTLVLGVAVRWVSLP